jgi:hypothetical protein
MGWEEDYKFCPGCERWLISCPHYAVGKTGTSNKLELTQETSVNEGWCFDCNSQKQFCHHGAAKDVNPADPDHYKSAKFEAWDVIEEWVKHLPGPEAYLAGSALKYLSRLGKKPGQDIKVEVAKAIKFLQRLEKTLG